MAPGEKWFEVGKTFQTNGAHALKATEMLRSDPGFLDRFLLDASMDKKVCSGCRGTLDDVQACMANAMKIDTQKGPTALSYQCAKNAMAVLSRIMEEEE